MALRKPAKKKQPKKPNLDGLLNKLTAHISFLETVMIDRCNDRIEASSMLGMPERVAGDAHKEIEETESVYFSTAAALDQANSLYARISNLQILRRETMEETEAFLAEKL